MISRRDFLKLAALVPSALAFRPLMKQPLPKFPEADKLGRITVGKMDVYARPDASSQIVGALYEDNVVPWNREIIGSMPGRVNQRFVETPSGFVWGGYVQPVWNKPNTPVASLLLVKDGGIASIWTHNFLSFYYTHKETTQIAWSFCCIGRHETRVSLSYSQL